MTNELVLKEKTNFMGIETPVIEGGFGEGQKVILAKTVAEIHEVETKYINRLINNNIDKFGVNDLVDCLSASEELRKFARENGLIGSNRTQNVFILSQRGYTKLVAMMDNPNDKKWDVMNNLIDDYFNMKKQLKEIDSKDKLLLDLFSNDPMTVANAHKQLVALETKPLLKQIEEQKPLVQFATQVTYSSDCIDVGQFAKVLKDENIKIGRNKLFSWLRENKYLMNNNEPYQKFIDNGYFTVVEVTKQTAYGVKIYTKTLITGKGQIYILEKLRG